MGGQRAHGLVIEEAVGQTVQARRLHKALFNVELHQSDALDQIPGDAVGQHGPGLLVILPHHKPHLRGIAPTSGAAHALQEAGDGEGRVDLKGPLQAADVNAQLQRGRGADAHEGVVVLHLLLGALPVGGGEIAVVDEEAVGLVIDLAVLPQLLADGLAFLPGIGEHQALTAPGVLKDVADARVGGLRRRVGGLLHRRGFRRDEFPFVRLGRGVVKVLHGKPPDLFAAVEFRDDGASAAARSKELSRQLRIPDGGGEADPSRITARQFAKPLDQAEGLQSTVRPQQGMDLVDDDKAQISEQGWNFHVLAQQQRFQRFRRDLQNARGFFQQLPFSGLGRIPVPAGDGDPLLLAQLAEAPELVVDQRLEGRNV